MVDSRDQIARIRATIEQADADLVSALDARAEAVREFQALRERDPDGYHVLPASSEVLERARQKRRVFPEGALAPVLREVLGACADLVAPVEVAVLGPEGGLTHLAARRWFGAQSRIRAASDVRAVFAEVERSRAQSAVVPFETSTDGALASTLQSLVEAHATVVGELTLPNAFHLWSRTGNPGDVEKIFGAATTIAACERTLKEAFPRAALLDVRSGFMAGELALEDHGAAALGSDLLAERDLYAATRSSWVPAGSRPSDEPLRIVRRNVEDDAGASTRFFVLGHHQPRRTGTDRTLLVLGIGEEPGSLYGALQPFAERSVNLTRLESRPARGGTGLFFVELDGHVTDRVLLTALDEVKLRARHLKVLGSYPRTT